MTLSFTTLIMLGNGVNIVLRRLRKICDNKIVITGKANQVNVINTSAIRLNMYRPKRSNQRDYKLHPYVFRKTRKTTKGLETIFNYEPVPNQEN